MAPEYSPRARDAGLARLRRLTKVLVAGSVVVTGVVAGVAAAGTPGRKLSRARTTPVSPPPRRAPLTVTTPVPAPPPASARVAAPAPPVQPPAPAAAPPVAVSGGS